MNFSVHSKFTPSIFFISIQVTSLLHCSFHASLQTHARMLAIYIAVLLRLTVHVTFELCKK